MTMLLISLLLSLAVSTTEATQPSVETIEPHLEMCDHQIKFIRANGNKTGAFHWDNDSKNAGASAPELAIDAFKDEVMFVGSWQEQDGSTWIINIDQVKSGKVTVRISIDEKDHSFVFDNFEKCLLNSVDLRKIIDERFFGSMGVPDLLAEDIVKRCKDIHWKPPAGLAEKIAAIVPKLDNSEWRVREDASEELVGTGIDGVIYVSRHVKKDDLSPEQASRIDRFIAFYCGSADIIPNTEVK
jgi:hypothetical protein